jgi:hypothetical protein
VAHGILNFLEKGYERVKKAIQDKMNEGKYAFVPDKTEANHLLNFSKNPTFKEIQMLVPQYRYIDLITTGLLIDYYHKHNTQENRNRIDSIKIQISKRPNGLKLLKLVNLPTTPFFSIIVQRLHELKKSGYPSNFLEDKFDELVENWNQTSLLVRTETKPEQVVSFCKSQIDKKSETFFVLGMKSAAATVEFALKELTKLKILENNNYVAHLTTSTEGNNPRTELMVYTKS